MARLYEPPVQSIRQFFFFLAAKTISLFVSIDALRMLVLTRKTRKQFCFPRSLFGLHRFGKWFNVGPRWERKNNNTCITEYAELEHTLKRIPTFSYWIVDPDSIIPSKKSRVWGLNCHFLFVQPQQGSAFKERSVERPWKCQVWWQRSQVPIYTLSLERQVVGDERTETPQNP